MKSLCKNNTSVSIFLNGKKVADTIQTNAMLYPSGMLVARVIPSDSEESTGGLGYTKHYFAGTQRVSSKIGTTENLGDFLQDWFTGGIGGPVDIIGSSFGVLENAEQGVIQVYHELEIEAPEYDSSPVFIPVQSFVHGDDENEIYWFHPDHLGSTSYITNLLGEVSQHMEYFAFGETFIEEHRSSNNSPYKFNGKELDEETGWYYYGARYYDPRVSVWLSVDPLTEQTMTPYQYTYQNPIYFIDPDGREPIKPLVGTAATFRALLDNSPRKVGAFKGQEASGYLKSLGNTEWSWKQMRPLPTQTGYFNNKEGRYVYTEEGGWIDMVHFMFYAGKAYQYKLDGSKNPIGEAVQDGYKQEATDQYAAPHSAYSYEDLPSDKFGADFAVNHFDPNSDLTFGEQLENYLNNVLKATKPENAPNYDSLPKTEPKTPTRTNKTTTPVYTEDNP
jgi:RHS repeat-associated protein